MSNNISSLLTHLGPPITDPSEETYHLFTQTLLSHTLGFIDPQASTLDLTIHKHTYTIHQSPSILSSDRKGGTTGAVLWQITPFLATYLSHPNTLLTKSHILTPNSRVLELGCGTSGLIALALSPSVSTYTLTDQAYVQKLLHRNLSENTTPAPPSPARSKKPSRKTASSGGSERNRWGNIHFHPLDWETDILDPHCSLAQPVDSSSRDGFDVVIVSDCVYNPALITPLVSTIVGACRLRTECRGASSSSPPSPSSHSHSSRQVGDEAPKTVCVIAQQLRSPEVFESWLGEMIGRGFGVWRVDDAAGLGEGTGFAMHFAILGEGSQKEVVGQDG